MVIKSYVKSWAVRVDLRTKYAKASPNPAGFFFSPTLLKIRCR